MTRNLIPVAMLALAGLLAGPAGAVNPYTEHWVAETRRCAAIDRSEYQAGLAFNPDGYRSYYVRSACFQDAAVKFRDEALCAQVRERWSFFWSSWGYSRKRCRALVAEGLAADRAALLELRRRYLEDVMTLRDFRVERNGNGRDFDIVPVLGAGYAHGYTLRFEFVAAGPKSGSALLAVSGFHLKGGDNIRLYVPQDAIRQRFPAFETGRRYRVRATITLDVGHGTPGGMWSEAFIESVFPEPDRTRVVEKEVRF